MTQNKIMMTIKPPQAKKVPQMQGMIALKKIQQYSYVLTDEIGLGFSSRVYKGKNDLSNQPVAVKVIDLKKQDQLSRQFMNDQINILEMIKTHNAANLLRLYDVFKTKNNLYIITEFCEGKDVAKLLRHKKKFTEIEAQSILLQLLNAYREIYQLSIVHRDLKLANIFIKKGVVKLADFGFAIHSEKCMQKFQYNVGSPYYMPPQALKFNRYSFKSDIWSLGIIAFEMAFGHLPWKEKIETILFEKITTTPVQELFDPDVQLSDHYKHFIISCLQIDYDKRATPEFVINYQWPLAQDFVEVEVESNTYKPLAMVKVASTGGPQVNTAKLYSANNIEEERREDKHILAHFGQPSLQLRNRSPAHKTQNKIALPFQQYTQRQKIIYREAMPKSPPATKPFDMAQNLEPQPTKVPQQSPPQISPAQTSNNAQLCILSQIYYCRFMSNLCDLLDENSNIPEGYLLKAELVNQIVSKSQNLLRLREGDNALQVEGFNLYRSTDKWSRLKDIISKYAQKYKQKYPLQFALQISEHALSNIIKYLKTNIPTYFHLLEQLTYFYQLRDMERRHNLWHFAINSKLELLSSRKPYSRKELSNPTLFERLSHRLSLLGF